jgi:hypothetical protein
MANPTTNYGFVLPTPTDLVTDLPADFDVALQGVDTRLKALNPSTTLGDTDYASATANTNTRLPIGSSGQVLTVSGGVPAWVTPSAGGLTVIESGSFTSTSTLISSIPTTYKQLILQINAWYLSATGWGIYLRLNDDSGASRYYNNVAFATTGQTAFNATKLELTMDNFGLTTSGYGSVTCTLPNYASTTAYKQAVITGVGQGNSTNPSYFTYQANGGLYNQLTAVTSLRITNGAGATQNGTYTLYGVS